MPITYSAQEHLGARGMRLFEVKDGREAADRLPHRPGLGPVAVEASISVSEQHGGDAGGDDRGQVDETLKAE